MIKINGKLKVDKAADRSRRFRYWSATMMTLKTFSDDELIEEINDQQIQRKCTTGRSDYEVSGNRTYPTEQPVMG